MSERRNEDWNLPDAITWEHVGIAVLMDIRRELRMIRESTSVLNCANARAVPHILRRIARQTDKSLRPKKRKRK